MEKLIAAAMANAMEAGVEEDIHSRMDINSEQMNFKRNHHYKSSVWWESAIRMRFIKFMRD